MGTLISALNIANEALAADQSALNITANNVANQNTAGYTREVPNFSTQDTYLLGGYEQADGVTSGTPTSIRDRVLEQRWSNASSSRRRPRRRALLCRPR